MTVRRHLTAMLLVLTIFSIKCMVVQGTYQLHYTIEVYSDGSALWVIEEKGIGLQPSIDEFITKVYTLVSVAQKVTQRNMTVLSNSFSMSLNVSGSYKVVKYIFLWKGFAKIKESEILIGDVFNLDGFFNYLYGNGAVSIKYPAGYEIISVFPAPHKRDDATSTIEWYGIEDFKLGEPKILLKSKPHAPIPFDKNFISAAILLALTLGGILGLYYHKSREKAKKGDYEFSKEKPLKKIENEEEMIISLLKVSGGRMYQSIIAEKCGFSRSKTSKLLKTLEKKGKIKREIKGREKIVTLLETEN